LQTQRSTVFLLLLAWTLGQLLTMPRYKRKSSALSTKKAKRMNKQGDVTASQIVDFSDVSSIEERAVEDAVEDAALEAVPVIDADADDSSADNDKQQQMDAATQCLLAGAVEVGDTLHPNARNLAIAYLFLEVHGAPEPTEWKGHGNVQTQIRKSLNISPNKSIVPVLELIWACYLCGRVYDGSPRQRSYKTDRAPKVNLDSVEAEMVASGIEDGMSFRGALSYINTWLQTQGKGLWTYWNITSLVERLNPEWQLVGGQSQGSRDPNSKWARARKGWTTHLMVRFGVADGIDLTKERTNEDGTKERYIPDYYDITKVTPINLNRTAFWDETHKECEIGGLEGSRKKIDVSFPRNEHGKLDPIGGTCQKERPRRLDCKYNKETRLLIGCATLKGDNDGPDRGVMLKAMSYSCKTVVSIEKWNEAINKQINYVKKLPGKGGVWTGGATTGRLFGVDHVKKMPGVGVKTTAQLALVGIRTVGELLAMTSDKRKQLANSAKWTKTKIDGLVQLARELCPNAAEQRSTDQRQPPPPN
jgi:hypothetical protein